LSYIVLFPFGQLLRIEAGFFTIHPADLIVFISIIFYFFGWFKKRQVFNYAMNFIWIGVFSLVLSLSYFSPFEVLMGSLYLVRLFSYFTFAMLVVNLINKKILKREFLLNSLILTSVFVGIYGWIQYLVFPDLTSLKYVGWDDHLSRIVGNFLDPGFTGIILVLGVIASFAGYVKKKSKILVVITAFLFITVVFTYSRSSYLALISGAFYLFLKWKNLKKMSLMLIIFAVLILLLPRPAGEGVRLERTQSVFARLQNYKETVEVIDKYPLFGVGFNNLCYVRLRLFAADPESHSCGGSDSSLLFILATTGIIGFLVFIKFIYEVVKNAIGSNVYGLVFSSSGVAIIIHSLFTQSLFYPWVMGWMGILLATTLSDE
jgi:O-antigen ligase